MLVSRSITLPQNFQAPKLPLWRTVAASYGFVARNVIQVLRVSWLPILAMLPVFALANWLVTPWQPALGQSPNGLLAEFVISIPGLLQLPFLASIAVTWHRLVLRGERVGTWFSFRLDEVVWKYAGLALALNMLMFAGGVYGGDDPIRKLTASLVSLGIIVFALPRLSLMLPAIALYRDLPFTEAWRATRANTWRLAIATMLCLVPSFALLVLPLMYVERMLEVSQLITRPVASAVGAIALTVSVTLLSYAFDHFIGSRANRPS